MTESLEREGWWSMRMTRDNMFLQKQNLTSAIYLFGLGNGTDSKNLFIGQYDKFFEEYWLSLILYLSPYRG